jgi:cytochrome c oxidase cbb3-type subunit I/II
MEKQKFYYDDKIVKLFSWATVVWGIIAFTVGLMVAYLYWFPHYMDGISWLSYGRLRPLHTNAAIFAFVGNGIFAGAYYSTQRLLKTRMYNDALSRIHFWGWQLIIVLAAITLPLGFTQSKEYAELEWPIDILVALVWVVFTINLIMTVVKRRVRHIYVAIWFYLSTAVTIAMLYIFNNLSLPVSLSSMKSYSMYSGVEDAVVQWWYGHNAVAFFLTTPILGLMYYFVPKAAKRPIYSYRLSIIHFWSLIFIYIWAGPHHLLYSAVPEWAQVLGTIFSLMLIFPSWGGMINGLLTLRGAWDRVREDPILKMFVVAITSYGMSTFEGPMLSFKSLNAIAHFTDWIVAHVHVGTLGWNGFIIMGMLYWMVPRLYKTKLYSVKLANQHFWIGTIGILLYVVPMYIAGWTQALMWKQFNPDGTLKYGEFMDTVTEILPMHYMRAIGGTLYLIGALMLVYNLLKTVKGHTVEDTADEAAPLKSIPAARQRGEDFHNWLERRGVLFTVLALIATAIGGAVEIIPTIFIDENIPKLEAVKPYTPLELEGRDIYVREGCYNCHSQMIRPFRSEVERYGPYSKAGEYVYDRPFQWGSKRTGPDLLREGGKRPNLWHFNHMYEPESMMYGSIMPNYQWIVTNDLDASDIQDKMKTLRTLGTKLKNGQEYYTDEYIANAPKLLEKQAKEIAADLEANNVTSTEAYAKAFGDQNVDLSKKEIVALIAYLQRLGTDTTKKVETAKK